MGTKTPTQYSERNLSVIKNFHIVGKTDDQPIDKIDRKQYHRCLSARFFRHEFTSYWYSKVIGKIPAIAIRS